MIPFRRITDHVLFRIVVVVAAAAGCIACALLKHWSWSITLLIVLILAVWWLWTLYLRQVRKVVLLLDALENNDNALRFNSRQGTKEDRTVNQLLNRVARILYRTKSEAVQQEKYYELILDFVNTGIIVLNSKGAVYQKNNEALRLLGLDILTHINQLNHVDRQLKERLAVTQAGDKFQIGFSNKQGQVNLSVSVSSITLKGEQLRILALNDINNELDEQEIDAWIRLIRVLTHEIMNSVTPISSISETLLTHTLVEDPEIRRGLQTISSTGKALLSFVDSYRKFTRIPTPNPSLIDVGPFIDRMIELARHQHPCNNITFNTTITPPDLILYADEQLISQVLINLLKNAIQAIDTQENGLVEITAGTNEHEEVWIEVSNNGPQIPDEVAKQLFIPFFTTKEGGSGVGLSLSRQIMRVSAGRLTLLPPQQEKKTTFRLHFK